AFDLRVEPTARPAAIDDSSRKFERGVFEREDLVVAIVRGVDGFANQLERLRLAPRSERDVVDAIRPGLDPQVFVVLRFSAHHRLAHAEKQAAARRHPLLAELTLVDRSTPAAVEPRELRQRFVSRWRRLPERAAGRKEKGEKS